MAEGTSTEITIGGPSLDGVRGVDRSDSCVGFLDRLDLLPDGLARRAKVIGSSAVGGLLSAKNNVVEAFRPVPREHNAARRVGAAAAAALLATGPSVGNALASANANAELPGILCYTDGGGQGVLLRGSSGSDRTMATIFSSPSSGTSPESTIASTELPGNASFQLKFPIPEGVTVPGERYNLRAVLTNIVDGTSFTGYNYNVPALNCGPQTHTVASGYIDATTGGTGALEFDPNRVYRNYPDPNTGQPPIGSEETGSGSGGPIASKKAAKVKVWTAKHGGAVRYNVNPDTIKGQAQGSYPVQIIDSKTGQVFQSLTTIGPKNKGEVNVPKGKWRVVVGATELTKQVKSKIIKTKR